MPFFSVCAYEAVPANTSLIVEWKYTDKLATKLEEFSYLKTKDLFLVEKLKSDYALLQKLFEEAILNQQLLNKSRVVAAMQASRSSDVNFTILLDSHKSEFDLPNFLSKLENYKVLPFNFKQHTIYSIKDKKGEIASIANYRGLLIFAKYAHMVEDAISQLKNISSNLCRNKAFKKANTLVSSLDGIKLYINFENIPLLYFAFLKNEQRKSADLLSNLGSWYRLDLSFLPRSIALNAKGVPPKGNSFYKAMNNSKAVKDTTIASVLPDNLAIMIRLGLENFDKFNSSFSATKSQDFKQYFLPWIDQTIAHVITEPYSNNLEAEQFALFKAKDIELTKHYLESLLETKGSMETYEYNTYKVQRLLLNDVLQPVFGAAINPIQNPYVVLLKNYLVFCNSKQALEIWIDKFIAGQTLDQDPHYLKFKADHEKAAKQIDIFVNPKKIAPIVKAWLKPELEKAINRDFDILNEINQLNLQANQRKGMLEIEGQVLYASEETKAQTSVVWKTNMKEALTMSPNILINPKNKEKEIFVQDAANFIYLLDSGGKLLWKRLIGYPIISKIHQIDYYKNGQGQFLFNTKNKIYLLDREGKDVSSFPLRLQSEITNGVCVIESEDLRDYHFFVACRNRNIYGFDRSGNPIPGWNPKTGVGRLEFPLLHFQEQEKDFILALNNKGKLFAFKRNGSNRFSPKSFNSKFLSPPDFQLLKDANRIVLGDANGKAHVVNFSGGSFGLKASSGNEKNLQFIFADVVGDQRKDYITMGAKKLEIFSYEGKVFKQEASHQYEQVQDKVFPIKMYGDKKYYVGSLAQQKKQINLVDASGKLYPGFPLAGTSKFVVTDLFNNNNNILVVANGNSIYTYKLQ